MAYFNTQNITDMHVKDIASREDISQQLITLDNEIVAVCISKGVLKDDIPIDINGYITSPMLIRYATFWIYQTLLSDYWGGASGEITDIYKAKLEHYSSEVYAAKADLTKENILNENLTQTSFIRQVVVY